MSPFTSAIRPDAPVGSLVAAQPAHAAVLERFGIDYCCGGKLSLRWFCTKRGLDLEVVLAALAANPPRAGETGRQPWPEAPLADLVAHLTTSHHAYMRAELPRLAALPAPAALSAALERFREAALPHLDHEERVVFPLIVRIERGLADRALARRFLLGQLAKLEREHAAMGADLDELRRLAEGLPPSALLDGLAGLLADTYQHVHKENEILFPRAAELVQPGYGLAANA